MQVKLRNILLLFILTGINLACQNTFAIGIPAEPTSSPVSLPFFIYSDEPVPKPFVPSGWMGDMEGIVLDESNNVNPYQGQTSAHITYTPSSNGQGWAGVYWLPSSLDPSKEWGLQVSGFSLEGATRLTFWVRGAQGTENIEFFTGGIPGSKGDSFEKISVLTTLTRDWKQYSIDLEDANLSQVIGAFGWTASEAVEFWLDEIKFEH